MAATKRRYPRQQARRDSTTQTSKVLGGELGLFGVKKGQFGLPTRSHHGGRRLGIKFNQLVFDSKRGVAFVQRKHSFTPVARRKK